MRRQQKWIEQLMNFTDLKIEAVPGAPIAELSSDERLLIEHHEGITGYDRTDIMVKVQYGILEVLGKDLEIQHMSKERLVIHGSIDRIVIHRGAKS